MKSRETYTKYSAEEFNQEVVGAFIHFIQNMDKLNVNSLSFPEWYETFGAWLEVNTDHEEMSWK